ncbi:MAG: 3-ketoacyl-ACP reductase [Actinobacteria bacterium HGW-Actinobacteria-1]|nr:MAG: 3-ketoacyl-ACP reductase [Actinobacteria bacterium HGW-Actinobacteria-1]
MRLEGKVAVITGAGSGMGRAMAVRFAAEGAKVVAADWHQDSLDETVAMITSAGGTAIGVQGNVADQAQAEAIIDAAVAAYGKVDVLCNNAGVMDTNQGAAELTNEMWERVLGINLTGPMYLTRKALPVMLGGGGGSIINTASVAGVGGGAAGLAYTVSKHGLVGLTKQTAFRYAQEGIRCNAIAAGAVETNIMQSVDPTKMDPAGSARCQTYYAAIPGQLKPEEIANLALFLASDESTKINGAIIPADAGWLSA